MATRYDGTEPNTTDVELVGTAPTGPQMENLDTLIAWHNADPPDATEMGRNDLIVTAYQHNRNPFIDHPEWVATIWSMGTGDCRLRNRRRASLPRVRAAICRWQLCRSALAAAECRADYRKLHHIRHLVFQ